MVRIKRVVGALGSITRLFSVAFAIPAIVAAIYEPWSGVLPGKSFWVFAALGVVFAGFGTLLTWVDRRDHARGVRDRDAYLTVGLAWLWLGIIASIPFLLLNILDSPIDAFFESMSGLTTTGSTVLSGLDALPESVLVWRALLQFLGGMGIIVLSVALISRMTQGGMQMLQAETPGPSFNRIAPRLASTARILWSVYLIMSAILFVILAGILYAQGFGLKETVFESLVHTMTTISTGGFSSHDASIAFFDSWIVESLLILFMLVSGTNFALHFHLLKGRPEHLTRDPEWRFFIATYLAACLVLVLLLWNTANGPLGGLRGAAFTAASLITSTGFATVDFDAWPEGAKMVLLLLMVTGASSGSTAGGLKIARVILIMQLVRQRLRMAINPRAIIPIRSGHRIIKESTTSAVAAFIVVFVGVWLAGAFLLLLTDSHFTSMLDAASASITALSNMGPGFGAVGPTHTFAELNGSSKLLLSLEMWFGRLEIFSALIIFSPEAWRS